MKEQFNLFKNLKLTENQHSNLLKKLLNPRGKHGQGDLFLKSFLEMLKVPYNNEYWTVNTEKKAGEKGRIDLIIYSKDKRIIIENKINGAVNQPNQLYRYWKNEIFNKDEFFAFCENKGMDLSRDVCYKEYYQSEMCKEKFKMIYLTKSISQNNQLNESIKKPDNPTYREKFSYLPDELPMEVTELNFRNDISNWLKTCLVEINNSNQTTNSNSRLVITLEQYIEFIRLYL